MKNEEIKLKLAKEYLIKITHARLEAANYKQHKLYNELLQKTENAERKLNQIVEKYFFTDFKLRRYIKKFINDPRKFE